MESLKKVFLVLSGGYLTDFEIEGVFTTRESAEEYAEALSEKWGVRRDHFIIDEWLVDVPRDLWFYTTVKMDKSGKVIDAFVCQNNLQDPEKQIGLRYLKDDVISYSVLTTDIEEAIRVVDGIRKTLLENGEWGNAEAVKRRFG